MTTNQLPGQHIIKWGLVNIVLSFIAGVVIYMLSHGSDDRLTDAPSLVTITLLAIAFSLATTWHLLLPNTRKATKINFLAGWIVYGLLILLSLAFVLLNAFFGGSEGAGGAGLVAALIIGPMVLITIMHSFLVISLAALFGQSRELKTVPRWVWISIAIVAALGLHFL